MLDITNDSQLTAKTIKAAGMVRTYSNIGMNEYTFVKKATRGYKVLSYTNEGLKISKFNTISEVRDNVEINHYNETGVYC